MIAAIFGIPAAFGFVKIVSSMINDCMIPECVSSVVKGPPTLTLSAEDSVENSELTALEAESNELDDEMYRDAAMEGIALINDIKDGARVSDAHLTPFANSLSEIMENILKQPHTIVDYVEFMPQLVAKLNQFIPATWSAYIELLEYKADALIYRVHGTNVAVQYYHLSDQLCQLLGVCHKFGLQPHNTHGIMTKLQTNCDRVLEAPNKLPNKLKAMTNAFEILQPYQSRLRYSKYWNVFEECLDAFQSLKTNIDIFHTYYHAQPNLN